MHPAPTDRSENLRRLLGLQTPHLHSRQQEGVKRFTLVSSLLRFFLEITQCMLLSYWPEPSPTTTPNCKENRNIIPFSLSLFLEPCPWHMEVPTRGVELKLQLPAYTTVTAARDPSLICDLHHSSQ